MITYFKGAYGLNLLFRVHGSAIYKAAIPGLFSVAIFLLIDQVWNPNRDSIDDLDHPYAIGILVSSVSFLIIFRANYGYQRYWEACGAVHHFMSKWMDATQHTGVFHLQCKHYDGIKPPNYFDHPDLNKLNLTRDREKRRNTLRSKSEVSARKILRSIERVDSFSNEEPSSPQPMSLAKKLGTQSHNPSRLLGPGRLDGGWGLLYRDDDTNETMSNSGMFHDPAELFPSRRNRKGGFAAVGENGRTPALFLQELAHLSSLCCAVALATLRNDIEGAESPLDIYHPGDPWPEADPDKLPHADQKEYSSKYRIVRSIQYWLGVDRSPEARTKYNATRPLLVIGGVSDNEIAFLQKAKGPSAKVTLAWHWLSEFIMREHLAGSLGAIGPPIVSRLIQFLSDGMIYYNHARKIMYIPFPFPHAQLSAFFNLTMIPAVPFLMDQYTNELWLGALLTFLTVTCLAGLHEVARELENPFRNVPNELPLCTLQAMYNEALVTMYAGFHPDHYWDPEFYLSRLHTEVLKEEELVENPDVSLPEQSKPINSSSGKKAPVDDRIQTLQDIMANQSQEIEKLREMLMTDLNDSNEIEKKPVLIEEDDPSPKKTQ